MSENTHHDPHHAHAEPTRHGHDPHHHAGHGNDAFTELMSRVMATSPRFGHREHIYLTWLAVREHGAEEAIGLVSAGIAAVTRAEGVPGKYHATITRAWVELVAHHAGGTRPATSFKAFAEANPLLLDKQLLKTFYRTDTLARDEARANWVEPDLKPFPWQHAAP